MLYHHENRFQAWKCMETTQNEQPKPRISIPRNQEHSNEKWNLKLLKLLWEGSVNNNKNPYETNRGEKNG